jgi:hypothetical protein
LAAALSQREALALSAPLIRLTGEAGSTSVGAIPPRVLALAEGVIQAMNMIQRKLMTTILLTAALIGGGAAAFAYAYRAEEPRPIQGEEKAADKKSRPAVAELARQRLQAAREVYKGLATQVLQGLANAESLANWSPHLLAAELDAATTQAERIAALEAHVGRLKDFEKQVKAIVAAGQARPMDSARVRCFRLEAELRLAKEKTK